MISRRQHAYEVLLRVAHVRELQANAALAEAASEQERCRVLADTARSALDTVLSAGSSCAESGHEIDIARYDLLRELAHAMSRQADAANESLSDATFRCQEIALESVKAKRYREKVGERVTSERESRMRAIGAKTLEESVELWAMVQGRGA